MSVLDYHLNKYKYLSLLSNIKGGGGSLEYNMTIKMPWFKHIRNGVKTVEGRLNKGLFARLNIGDIITWVHKGKKCKTQVTFKHEYSTFRELLENETLKNVLPGIFNIDEGVKIYRQYYDKKREKKHGVVAIGMALVNENTTHQGKLVDPHYSDVKNGSKIYEVRVNDPKRQKMKVGDNWTFSHNDKPELPLIHTKIVGIDLFDSFKAAIEDSGIQNVLPHAADLKSGIEMYNNFPHAEGTYRDGAEKYGVVRFKLEVL